MAIASIFVSPAANNFFGRHPWWILHIFLLPFGLYLLGWIVLVYVVVCNMFIIDFSDMMEAENRDIIGYIWDHLELIIILIIPILFFIEFVMNVTIFAFLKSMMAYLPDF